MAAEILTPSCETTGLPLPIAPLERRETGVLSIPGATDEHHHFHPERHPLLLGVAGLAVRHCRIQKVGYALHHYGYNNIFRGPSLPATEDEVFRTTVLAAAGVVPRQAIKINAPDDWEIVDIDDIQHKKISSAIKVDQAASLSRFFAEYASKQKIEDRVDELVIEQLLDLRTPGKKKKQIASLILGEAVDESVKSAKLPEYHNTLKAEGFFASRKPQTPYSVTKGLVRRKHLQYFGDLVVRRFAMA